MRGFPRYSQISNQGKDGATGPRGINGYQGKDGKEGPTGPKGINGESFNVDETGNGHPSNPSPFPAEGYGYLDIINNELYISTGSAWSHAIPFGKGDSGTTGPQGVQGVIGTTGPIGPRGTQGTKGDPGNTGPQGSQGTKGDPGNTGPQGSQGTKGDPGNTGPQGSQGTKGDPGNTGPQGSQGTKGDPGNTGPQGTQGIKGDTGNTGPQGTQGIKGEIGTTGPQGTQGTKGETGTTGPQGTQGIKGEIGTTGPQGLQGSQGIKGDTGTTGPQGVGTKGDKGNAGDRGLTGVSGATGPTGSTSVWFESWNMNSENTNNAVSLTSSYAYFNGFWAQTTGSYTHMRFRVNDVGGGSTIAGGGEPQYMIGGIYSAYYPEAPDTGRDTASIKKPLPDALLTSGKAGRPTGGGNVGVLNLGSLFLTDFYFEVKFDSPVTLTRDTFYYIAIKAAREQSDPESWSPKLYGNNTLTNVSNMALTWEKNNNLPNSNATWDSLPSNSSYFNSGFNAWSEFPTPNANGNFWYQIYGPQTTAGANAGPAGPSGATGPKGG